MPLQQRATHARQTTGPPRCSMSVTEPLLAAPEEAEQSPHGPPAPFWQATLTAASSAPRPNLAASLGDPTSPARQPQHAASEVLPGSSSSVQKQALPDQDEEHMRQHVQKWLNAAAAAASGTKVIKSPGNNCFDCISRQFARSRAEEFTPCHAPSNGVCFRRCRLYPGVMYAKVIQIQS